jgi:pyruvate kinase
MLSAETAVGDYPVETVTLMDRIVHQAEAGFESWGHYQDIETNDHDDAVAVTRAARELAHDQDVAAVAVFTRLGRSALLMAKSRPRVPILAFTSDVRTYRRLAMAWGVDPRIVPFVDTVEAMFQCVETALRDSGTVKPGQQVVLLCGFPILEMGQPNMVLLHTLV